MAFSRTIGALFGNALFGALLSARLAVLIDHEDTPASGELGDLAHLSPERLAALPPGVLGPVTAAYAEALATVFLWAAPLLAVGCCAALRMPNLSLRTRTDRPAPERT